MPESDGNDTQARIIARQLFDVWKAEQEAEAKAKQRWLGNNLAGWVSVCVVVVGTIYAGSKAYDLASQADARSIRNEAAIAVIKADTSDRLARIETKLDLVIDERTGRETGR